MEDWGSFWLFILTVVFILIMAVVGVHTTVTYFENHLQWVPG